MQRPGAIEQLKVLGERIDIPVFNIPGGNPVEICTKRRLPKRRSSSATRSSTTPPAASRSTKPLMQELADIKSSPSARRTSSWSSTR
jgi:signal recognition particle subunit SRP54